MCPNARGRGGAGVGWDEDGAKGERLGRSKYCVKRQIRARVASLA